MRQRPQSRTEDGLVTRSDHRCVGRHWPRHRHRTLPSRPFRHRHRPPARDTLADLPVADRLRLDATDGESVRAAIADAGPLDAIVSNAGATIRGTVEVIPLDEYERLLQLNFLGALRLAKAVSASSAGPVPPSASTQRCDRPCTARASSTWLRIHRRARDPIALHRPATAARIRSN